MAKRTEYQITIDDALTKALSQHNLIHDYMVACAADLYQKFLPDKRVFFYVKGSAALSRYLRNAGADPGTVGRICARSDWDTQLVINPWLSRADWFAALQDCLTVIRECLGRYEEGLLAVFAQIFPGQQAVEQSALARALRAALAAEFGRLFIDTSRTAEFIDNGPHHWDLRWQNILALANGGRTKDILEMDIQAHSQATLTNALIHPGQPLDNLNSIMTGRELNRLMETTRTVADEAWTEVDEASEIYDQLRMKMISQTPKIVEFLRGKSLESLSEVALINALPPNIIDDTIRALPDKDQGPLKESWKKVKVARDQQLINAEGGSVEETRFGQALGASLKANQNVATELGAWCLDNMNVQPAMLAAIAALHDYEITTMLSQEQKAQLDVVWEQVEAQLERYREKPDPEDAAEAEKKETESLAPFTLVGMEKGSRKLGSILENMTIRDFYLFRLMIRCQLSNKDLDPNHPDPNNRLIPAVPPDTDFDVFKQQFKFRAELLDISVPRDDSLETAEQWVHVKDHVKPDNQGIPLPDGSYFLDEYILMFREVLDKKSSSAHKLTKRLERACLIAEAYAHELGDDRFVERVKRLTARYPLFDEIMQAVQAGGVIAPANLLVFMRMCEQLVESYDLACNERLRDDSRLMMGALAKQIKSFLGAGLTDKTFLELMRIYAQLSGQIYNESFLLANLRRKNLPDDKLISEYAAPAMAEIAKAFRNDPQRFRCAVVEDFAIDADPDLPFSLKQDLPLNVLTIAAYTNDAGGGLMRQVAEQVKGLLTVPRQGIDAILDGNILYVRHAQEPEESMSGKQSEGILRGSAMAVFLKIKFIIDNNVENWIAPAHPRDLRAIVKQYRRSLPGYTDYHVLSRKMDILRRMETALTTY
jgi:hypothetical protein